MISIDRFMDYKSRTVVTKFCHGVAALILQRFLSCYEVVPSLGEMLYFVVHFHLVGDKSWVLVAIF